ncbi:MAG TPA: hypothetical protein PKA00_09505 [Saprospiraceae bacterium]|nr:hypothetical protein [Saprospiraceae bacterium]HMQ83134.1 hypothetical protein [Saprospiraceae bacterium]
MLHFLDKTSHGQNEVPGREVFEDTEVNEGKWLLEASGNYVKNPFLQHRVDEIKSLTKEIVNVTDANGQLMMSGNGMVQAFNETYAQISNWENQLQSPATMMDVNMVSLDANKTIVKFDVVFERAAAAAPATSGPVTWDVAIETIKDGVALSIAQDVAWTDLNCPLWIPELIIYDVSNFDPDQYIGHHCFPPFSSTTCARTVFLANAPEEWVENEPYGSIDFTNFDIAVHINIADWLLDSYTPIHYPSSGTYIVVGSEVERLRFTDAENGVTGKRNLSATRKVVVGGYTTCL